MPDFIKTEIRGGVAIATMMEPETRNALGKEHHFRALEDLCTTVGRDRSIRALVLTGSGKAFCAGGDIKNMLERASDPNAEAVDERYGYKEGFHRIPRALYELEVPTIAAINGAAIGAGLDLALMCDIRLASTQAKFAESFVTLGIIPGDGGAWLLQRIVGPSAAAELTFTGETIDAVRALEIGLIGRVCEPDDLMPQALALADRIAANPGHALRMAKRLMREAQYVRLETSLEMAGAFQGLAHFSRDHRERVAAAVQRISATKK